MVWLSLIAVAATCLIAPCATYAQAYPSKPIRLIVASAAGGLPDIAVRGLANELGNQMGQLVVVDNRPGANSIVGYEILARAAPDGYTLGYVTNVIATNTSTYSKLPYDFARDFQPVVLAGSTPNLLTVSPSLPVRSVKELIEHARANPGKLSYGSTGPAATQTLGMELLRIRTGAVMVQVTYKSIQQAISDEIAGQIHVVNEGLGSILPHYKAGKVRALGITSLTRSPLVPEVPTIDEAGIPGYEIRGWGGYAVPARVPREIVLRLNGEINKAQLSPSVVKGFAARGSTPEGGTPEQFAEHIRAETDKWAKVIKAAGIKPQ